MAETLKALRFRLRNALAQMPYLPLALSLVWNAARVWTFCWALLLLLQGLIPILMVYLTREVVNSITLVVQSGAPELIRRSLILVALLTSIQLLSELLRVLIVWVRETQSELVYDHINVLIHEKAISLDLSFFESPEFYDRLHRACMDAIYRPLALLEGLGSLLQNTITLIAMAAVLIPFGFWLPLALLASTAPAMFVLLRYAVIHHEWESQNTQNERRTWYYTSLITTREPAFEIRLFDLGHHFSAAFQTLRKRLRGEKLHLLRKQNVGELLAGLSGYLISGAAFAWMVWRTVQKAISLGDLAMFYQAYNQGQRLMRSALENVSKVYENILFVGNLFEFLQLQPKVTSPSNALPVPRELKTGIRFHQISFHYPGTETPVLAHFDLEIEAGKIAAIVGPNGAGKSTMIKLLCRLYDPDSGTIEFDGIDLRQFDLQELRQTITVLFQEPVHYSATVNENIGFGDLRRLSDDAFIQRAAQDAGAESMILRLPQRYETMLGRGFIHGTELSVGEWQRLSLARAFLREAPIILLDEPTSAMDSWTEVGWMRQFRILAKGRTALIITHRFTTAMQADEIHVMENGRIIESGSHEQLIQASGEYARSWLAQMQSGHRLSP